jgi:hypothetical protein
MVDCVGGGMGGEWQCRRCDEMAKGVDGGMLGVGGGEGGGGCIVVQ